MKTSIIIEARVNSSRLPGKVLREAVGKPMLELMIERLRRCRLADDIIVATTENTSDLEIADLCERLKVSCFRGSENDVLGRVLGAALANGVNTIVEIPGDCPLIDPEYVDLCICRYRATGADYVSSVLSRTFPHGTEAQVFSTSILQDASSRTDDPWDREHVTPYIYGNPDRYLIEAVEAPAEVACPEIHLTLDEIDDYRLINEIFETLYTDNPNFGLIEILALLRDRPSLAAMNTNVKRVSGF